MRTMRTTKTSTRVCVAAVQMLLMAGAAHAQHQHEGDIIIGVSAGPDARLCIEMDPDVLSGLEPIELLPSSSPSVAGWLGVTPGFEALESDEPDEGFFRLATGAQVRLVGLDLDPGLFVRAASLGTPIRIRPTPELGSLDLGDEALHTHAVWHLDPSAPGFDGSGTQWAGKFRLADTGSTGYADSTPFTLHFTVVPEPAAFAALACLASVIVLARRAGVRR